MAVLADSSIWIDFFRRGREGSAWPLDDLLAREEVLVCGPIVAELLAGTSGGDSREVWETVSGLPWVSLGRAQWRRVGELASALRVQRNPVPLTDIEIAVAAEHAEAALWTLDNHFERLGAHMPQLRFHTPIT